MRAELREHYTLLKQQRDDMMRLQLQKERLTAFVVHDLKNPVNTLDLHAQLLLRDKSLSQSARDSATQIRTEARQLNRMILNLLDVSKADEGKLAPNRGDVDLESLVAQVVAELEESARARNVTIEVALEAKRVSADEDLLRRAIANLAGKCDSSCARDKRRHHHQRARSIAPPSCAFATSEKEFLPKCERKSSNRSCS